MKKLLFLLLLVPCLLSAQNRKEKKDVERRLNLLVDHLEIQPHKDTVKNWVDWIAIGESASAETAERAKGWNNFLLSLYDNMGTVSNGIVNRQILQSWSSFLTGGIMRGRVLDLDNLPETVANDQLGEVEVIGEGSATIVLLAPIGFNWRIYEDLINRHKTDYQFVAITLPGNGGSPGYAFPNKRKPSEAAWLKLVEQNIIKTLQQRGINEYFVMSMGSSSYTATRLALVQPSKVKGLINVNGGFAGTLNDPDNSELRASLEYRQEVNQNSYPTAMLIDMPPSVFNNYMDFTKDAEKQQAYAAQIKREQIPGIFRYLLEYNSQDIWNEVNELKAPMLNLISVYDSKSMKASNKGQHRFWQEVAIEKPNLKINNIFIPDARDASYIDSPEVFDFYLGQFLKNPSSPIRQITSNNVVTALPQPSPAASLSQTFGAIQVGLDYHKPSVNSRKVFGELVPYGQVWRAGANEATRITFSNDVEVNGQNLKRGTYSLFAIPNGDSWTMIFNKVSEQWGAFTYNSRFDAARVEVKPESSAFTETLEYRLKNIGNESIQLSLAWENTTVRLDIKEAFELPKPPARIMAFNWQKLLEDKSGDGVNPGLTDGKSLSYYLDKANNMLWFKFDLHSDLNPNAFAMNVLIDTDANQETGLNWFGTNTAFKFEKCLTLWMRREGTTYGGTNGITDQSGIFANEWNRLKKNNLTYYLDDESRTYTVGVSLTDLDISNDTIHLIGAVGEYMTWNDDIGDEQYATIKLKD